MIVSASIVLFKSDFNEIKKITLDILKYQENTVFYLVDNSPKNTLHTLAELHPNIQYIHLPNNPGFGAAHNIAFKKALENHSKYHFVINPDVVLQEDVVSPMACWVGKR